MNDTLKYIGVAVLAGLLVFAGFLAKKPVTITNNTTTQSSEGSTFGALTGPDISSPYLCVSDVCAYYYSGEFKDATTTLFSIPTPNGATSTVDYVQLYVKQSGTSSIALYVATSTVGVNGAYAPLTSTGTTTGLVNGYYMPTSTTTAVIFNGVDDTSNGNNGGVGSLASKQRILLNASGAGSSLVGWVFSNANGSPAGVVNPTNTFTGTYKVRILQGKLN